MKILSKVVAEVFAHFEGAEEFIKERIEAICG